MTNKVAEFVNAIESKVKQNDTAKLVSLLSDISGYQPQLQGSIIGFGRYHYCYDSGREGDSFVIGLSPRKQNIVLYIMPGFSDFQQQLSILGKHKTGKSCLYINKLDDIDLSVLTDIASQSIQLMQQKYQCSET